MFYMADILCYTEDKYRVKKVKLAENGRDSLPAKKYIWKCSLIKENMVY